MGTELGGELGGAVGGALGGAPMPAGADRSPAGPDAATATAAIAGPEDGPLLPVPLKPMTVSDLLDGAWAVITCRPRTLFGISALIMAPTALVGSVLVRTFGDSLGPGTLLRVFFPYIRIESRASPGWLQAAIAVAVLSLGTMVLGVAVARVVAAWYDGRELTAGAAVVEALQRSWRILAAFFILLVPKALAIGAFLIPAWLLFPFVLLVAPVIAIEDAGPLRAIRRSMSLVSRRYFPVLGVWSIWLISERTIAIALGFLPDVVSEFTPDSVDAVLQPAGWAFVLFFTAPAVAGMAVLLYFDLRVRTEGLDIELEAREAFARG